MSPSFVSMKHQGVFLLWSPSMGCLARLSPALIGWYPFINLCREESRVSFDLSRKIGKRKDLPRFCRKIEGDSAHCVGLERHWES